MYYYNVIFIFITAVDLLFARGPKLLLLGKVFVFAGADPTIPPRPAPPAPLAIALVDPPLLPPILLSLKALTLL